MGLDQLKLTLHGYVESIDDEALAGEVADLLKTKLGAAYIEEENLTEEQLASLQKAVRDFHAGRRDDLIPHEEVMKKYAKWL